METLARHELKYAVRPDLLEAIRAFIRPYCSVDPHAGTAKRGFYTIDSLYFDSDDYRCYRDTRMHAPVRAKLRVRTYPDKPGSIVKLEVKNRIRDLIIKSSTVVPGEDWPRWIFSRDRSRAPDDSTRPALDEFLAMMQALRARPKMLVRYQRLAFFGTIDDYARVTFDRNMLSQPMRHYELEGWPNAWMPMDDPGSMRAPSGLIMELKFRRRAPLWMADLVRRFGLVRQGYSKYGCAVTRHLVEGVRYWDTMPHLAAGEAQWIS